MVRSHLKSEGLPDTTPFGVGGVGHIGVPTDVAAPNLSQAVFPILGPFMIYGLLGLFATIGWLVYRALFVEVSSGVPVYTALAATIAVTAAGRLFSHWRDIRRLKAAAVVQIVVTSCVATWAAFSTQDPWRWLGVVGGILAVADGFKVFYEIRRLEGKPLSTP